MKVIRSHVSCKAVWEAARNMRADMSLPQVHVRGTFWESLYGPSKFWSVFMCDLAVTSLFAASPRFTHTNEDEETISSKMMKTRKFDKIVSGALFAGVNSLESAHFANLLISIIASLGAFLGHHTAFHLNTSVWNPFKKSKVEWSIGVLFPSHRHKCQRGERVIVLIANKWPDLQTTSEAIQYFVYAFSVFYCMF